MRKSMCDVYVCDECKKKIVDEDGTGVLAAGWIEIGYPHSFAVSIQGWIIGHGGKIEIDLKNKHFCGTLCLTSHIGQIVSQAMLGEQAMREEKGNDETLEAVNA